MTDEAKFLFKMHSSSGYGILDFGYYNDSMVFIEVTSGEVILNVGTDTDVASEGDIIFVPPTLVFSVEAKDKPAAIRRMTFNSSIIEENMENFDAEIFYMFYVQSRSSISIFKKDHPVYNTLAFCISECHDEYVSKEVFYMLPIRANVCVMMSSILRYYSGMRGQLDRMIYHNVMRLRPVIEYITENYADKIYIETLSDMITVSPDYFTKMFKDSFGKTPVDYINSIRVNHSLRLLSLTDIPVNEIADKTGFSNPNYFHKIFKQYMITSPLAYRKASARGREH